MFASKSNHRGWLGAILGVVLLVLTGAVQAINWNYLDGPFGAQPVALYNDAAGNTWAGMNGGGVFYRAAGATTWTFSPGVSTQSNYELARSGSNGTVYISGSAGLFALPAGAGAWVKISGSDGFPGEAGGGLATDAQGNVYAGANNNAAVFRRAAAGGAWTTIGTGLPAGTSVELLAVDSVGTVWAAIYGSGVYKLPAGGATWIAVNDGLTSKQISAIEFVGSDLFATTRNAGAFKLPNARNGGTNWSAWNGGSVAASTALYDLAAAANGTLYAAASGVVHALASGASTWTTLGTGLSRFDGLYGIVANANGSLTVSHGSGISNLPAGGNTWQLANDGLTSSTVYGIAVAANGDVYAGTFGQGVMRKASGTDTWSPVDPDNANVVIQAVVIDGHGTVYEAGGGVVRKLVGGVWTLTGNGNDMDQFPRTLTVDAQNNVWAGGSSKVYRIGLGGSTWTTVGTGLPSRSSYGLVIDDAGNAWNGMYEGGVYKLAAGGSTWVEMNTGLPDLRVQALARNAANEIYAGISQGVYKLSGTTWSLVGTGLTDTVTALVIDANGDIYAGVENGYAWRLASGTTEWKQIALGLTPRVIRTLVIKGGRVYAGSDASYGSPSGVFVLSLADTIVEFYNSILDHFFITATAAEQDAILGGSAGPGWTMTGNVFSAGGATLVCRFYGSVNPGPNSHFYTINPAECQELKDIQAQTPANLKRWNFESNDFASTNPTAGQCPAGMLAVYRAYNNGFSQGIDSNHRITSNRIDYLNQVAKGWIGEGTVMCAPK